jgi:flagellar basal body-associated protein FliL
MGLFFLGALAAGILGGIISVFLSKKSSKPLKLAALGVLVLSAIALAICAFILFSGPGASPAGPYDAPALTQSAPPAKGANIVGLVIFLVVLLVFFGFVIYFGMKDQKKKALDKAIVNTKDSELEEDSFD